MKRWGNMVTGILTTVVLTGTVSAAQPSKGDMDQCNQKAAQLSKATPVKPGAGNTASSNPPAASNPTGGRMSDSTPPGVSPSQLGMAPIGETDQAYRQAYLGCINERMKSQK